MNTKNSWKFKFFLGLIAVSFMLGLAFGLGGFRVNLTASLPKGIYRLTDAIPGHGDLVTFCLESSNPFCGLAGERGYLPAGSCPSGLQPLLKRLVGLPGDLLEITTAGLTLNGRPLPGTVRPERDRLSRDLPPSLLKGGFIPDGMALLLSQEHLGSFDSRHFGLAPLASLQTAEPVWIWDSAVVKNVNVTASSGQIKGFPFNRINQNPIELNVQVTESIPIAFQRVVFAFVRDRLFFNQKIKDFSQFLHGPATFLGQFHIAFEFFGRYGVAHSLQPHILKKFFLGFIPDTPAFVQFLHSLDGFPVRGVQFKGQGFFPGHLGQKNPAGLGNGQAHSGQHISRLGLDLFVDTRPENSILGHSQPSLSNRLVSNCTPSEPQTQIYEFYCSEEIFDAPCRALGIPKALAMAIARVESNFRPWTLNIEGQSFFFDSREEALGKAREARRAGRSFDTGLMQVNDWWLKKYDIPLEAAIDPVANIYIGGWILKQELDRHGGDVRAAVGAYHSPKPARAERYAKLVLGAVNGAPRHQAAPRSARASEVRPTSPKTSAPMLVASKHKTLAQGQSLKASATAAANSMKVNL